MLFKLISISILLLFALTFMYYNLPEYYHSGARDSYTHHMLLAQVSNESTEEISSQGKDIFEEHIAPIGEGILEKVQEFFRTHIVPLLESLWGYMENIFKDRVEPVIEEKTGEITDELKEGIDKEVEHTKQSLWEKFKEMIDEQLDRGEEASFLDEKNDLL